MCEAYDIPMSSDIVKPKVAPQTGAKQAVGVNTNTAFKNSSPIIVEPKATVETEKVKPVISDNNKISYTDLTEEEKRDILKLMVENNDLTIKLNHEKQAPHMYDSKEYDPSKNKSYFTISEEELQEIINQKHATGYVTFSKNGQCKETIEIDRDIGMYMLDDCSDKHITNRITIHYSKRRTHMVPARKMEENNE